MIKTRRTSNTTWLSESSSDTFKPLIPDVSPSFGSLEKGGCDREDMRK